MVSGAVDVLLWIAKVGSRPASRISDLGLFVGLTQHAIFACSTLRTVGSLVHTCTQV